MKLYSEKAYGNTYLVGRAAMDSEGPIALICAVQSN